ncbi:MAG: 3-hydroxyacyl-ACP dehydratase FabZ [Miltoncostaeaceae bacterium]
MSPGEPRSVAPTELLPHRPPFLFVDEIVDLRPGESARARWFVDPEAAFFEGHFPGNPILPGVIIVEALAQTGALAALADPETDGKLALFAGIDKVRFRRPVRPGDTLDMATTLTRRRGPIGEGKGAATVDGERACEALVRFALVDIEEAMA